MEEKQKKQLITWVTFFIIVILVIWIWSWQWVFEKAGKIDEIGSLNSTINNISEDWQGLQDQWERKTSDLNSVVEKVKASIGSYEKETKDLTAAFLKTAVKEDMVNWKQYNEADLNFLYPEEWRLQEDNSRISLIYDGKTRLTIDNYKESAELPDNVNNSDLEKWLQEQKSRTLGLIKDYKVSSEYDFAEKTYELELKVDDEKNIIWQDQSIHWLKYNKEEEFNNIYNLIISSIK